MSNEGHEKIICHESQLLPDGPAACLVLFYLVKFSKIFVKNSIVYFFKNDDCLNAIVVDIEEYAKQ